MSIYPVTVLGRCDHEWRGEVAPDNEGKLVLDAPPTCPECGERAELVMFSQDLVTEWRRDA